jgi:hypothetical protein
MLGRLCKAKAQFETRGVEVWMIIMPTDGKYFMKTLLEVAENNDEALRTMRRMTERFQREEAHSDREAGVSKDRSEESTSEV